MLDLRLYTVEKTSAVVCISCSHILAPGSKYHPYPCDDLWFYSYITGFCEKCLERTKKYLDEKR